VKKTGLLLTVFLIAVCAAFFYTPAPLPATAITRACANPRPVPASLRLPAVVPPGEPVAIERRMLTYLQSYGYRDLGWCEDKSVRDTGPFIGHVSYGTHPAVRIYYSPEVMEWLRNGRRGVPKDGAVIIKEQYGGKPAIAFAGLAGRELRPADWTIMIRRSSASHDGWFWAEVYTGMFATPIASVAYPNAGFGLYCLRCHGSAERALTFSSLENIAGFPGESLVYRVDDSWRWPVASTQIAAGPAHAAPVPLAVQTFPPESLDTFVARAGHAGHFVTSSECMTCHSAAPAGAPFGPVMWVTPAPASTAPGRNVSEYGEWRWSPMGLAGRDPAFFAQLESELRALDALPDKHTSAQLKQQTIDTCMTCHGVMGKRSFAQDHPRQAFSPAFVFDADPSHESFHYGGLARDGISCAVCHHIAPSTPAPGKNELASFLETKSNGHFDMGHADRLFGPFENAAVVTHTMNEATGAKPIYSSYITSSRMCASCHTINLPVVDRPPVTANPQTHSIEQATYLEWLNSRYQDEYGKHPGSRSCQACHMAEGITDPSRGVALAHIASRIALVQDTTYPATTHAAPLDDLNVRYRETGYHRHELVGLNAFLLTAFRQFSGVMGVRTTDYMSGSTTGIDDAIAGMVQQAQTTTARLAVRSRVAGGKLLADVEVTNLTGHRFPSGVGFRRAFLDVEVRDAAAPANAPPVFASGRTDARGRITGDDGKPLPSESFARDSAGHQQYQDHFDEAHPITRSDQVQIFEELTRDHKGNFTTSFIRRDEEVKDNRLLPSGWTKAGPTALLPAYYLHATYPKGRAARDPRYSDGRGHAIVRYAIDVPPGVDPAHLRVTAQLYYQSWAPYFLEARAAVAGLASLRFSRIVDGLDLSASELQGWKIHIADATAEHP
jgi:hypothetical protein